MAARGRHDSSKNMAARGRGFYQDCSSPHDTSKNMAIMGRGLFSLYIYVENFKILLVRNHSTDFNIT